MNARTARVEQPPRALRGGRFRLMFLGDFDEGIEICGRGDGHFAQHLTVQLHTRSGKPEDEPAVADTTHPARSR